MSEIAQPILLGTADRQLFGVRYAPTSPVRAGVLICPPLFHEQFLSYRLLSLTAARLSEAGLACLRFDYNGSGDSQGDDAAFSLAGAIADTRTALQALRAEVGAVPIVVVGVRAGIWPALAVVESAAVERVCLWQPLASGSAWLQSVLDQDAVERASKQRYPFARPPGHPADPDHLLGYRVDHGLRGELATQVTRAPASSIPFDVVGDSLHLDAAPHLRQRFALPASLAGWEDELTIRNAIPGRDVAALAKSLASAWLGSAHA